MPSVEERVAYLEGAVGEHTRAFASLRHSVADVRTGLTELRTDMNARFDQVDGRFTQIDGRFLQIDGRFAQVEQRLMWLIGTQLAVLLAVIAALAGAYYR